MSENNNLKLFDYFVVIDKLGSGSFGDVYVAQTKNKKKLIAVKFEKKSINKKNRILKEYLIYKNIYAINKSITINIPKIYGSIETNDYHILMMELLGPNLEDLFNNFNRKFKINTVILLAINLIDLLKRLHLLQYIHRDVKPNNFLIGKGYKKTELYVMDFGLSKKYIDDNNDHIKFRDNLPLIGTARYISINIHDGHEPSRRDDLESVAYILIYFLKGQLPWQGLKKNLGANQLEQIKLMKQNINVNDLCSNLPICFKIYLEYCRHLEFNETPKYEYLKNLFSEYSRIYNIPLYYEWSN